MSGHRLSDNGHVPLVLTLGARNILSRAVTLAALPGSTQKQDSAWQLVSTQEACARPEGQVRLSLAVRKKWKWGGVQRRQPVFTTVCNLMASAPGPR